MKLKSCWNCTQCSHTQSKWTGQCSQCHSWNTFIEKECSLSFDSLIQNQAIPLNQVKSFSIARLSTKLSDFDQLLGGGIVPGSLILIGGDPGIGKSTLLLQIAGELAQNNQKVLYVCGEESIEQTFLRACRLQIDSSNISLLCEVNFENIKQHLQHSNPEILIIDSIQIIYDPNIPSSQGSIIQIREITSQLMRIAKSNNIAIFIIGHVTKTGEIAGPRILEHLVDTVLYFEGENMGPFRLIRSIKNRFGATNNIVIFEMTSQGLKEVLNPSDLFLKERNPGISGSIIVPTLQGSRPVLVELQALVTQSFFSNAARKTAGIDPNRFSLLLAVLEKRIGIKVHNQDIFLSVAGGLKITETATDLGALLAVYSSLSNKVGNPLFTVIGEVGLGGEVRNVPLLEQRIKESIIMGFSGAILPYKQKNSLSKTIDISNFKIIEVKTVKDALEAFLN